MVQPEQVERAIVLRRPPPHQVEERWLAIGAEVDDLAVEDRVTTDGRADPASQEAVSHWQREGLNEPAAVLTPDGSACSRPVSPSRTARWYGLLGVWACWPARLGRCDVGGDALILNWPDCAHFHLVLPWLARTDLIT
jgi:hypothetical protein